MEKITEQYNDLCEITKTGWWAVNLNERKITVDNYLQRILQLNVKEVTIDKFAKCIISQERNVFRMALKLLAYDKAEFNCRMHFLTEEGTSGADLLLNKTYKDEEGKVYKATGVIRIAPETQDFSGSLLNLILKYIPMYFFIKDVENNSKYIYCSPMMRTLFQFHREDPVGRTDYEMFADPEIAHFFRTKDLEVYHTGQPQHYCENVVDADGNKRVMDTIKVLMKRENRPPYILGMSWDLTYQKKIESLLCECNMRVHMACKAGSIYPWTWNMEEKNVEITYAEDDKVVTRNLTHKSFLADIHPDDLPVFEPRMRAFMNSEDSSVKVVVRSRCFTNKYDWYELIGNVYGQDNERKRSRVVGILRNITEMKQHQEILEESERMKTAFLSSMSHEIRTPLNAIIGFSSLLANTEEEEQKAEFIDIIETNNELLLRLINDMMDVAKFESGRPELHYTEFALNDIFTVNQYYYSRQAKEGVEFIFENDENDILIVSDKNCISQVLSHFLSNAQKFTEKGEIRFGYQPTEKGLFVYVKDSGFGIPAKLQPLIFDRFMKGDSYSQGMGLGLFISKTIVKLLKGEIGVISNEGKGSTFWFKIPCSIHTVGNSEEIPGATVN